MSLAVFTFQEVFLDGGLMSDPMRDPTDFALTTSPPDDDKQEISPQLPRFIRFIAGAKKVTPKYY